MRIPSPRVQILDKQQELERTHCEGCDIRNKISIEKTADIAFRNCLDNCNIGKHLNHLGKMLLDHKAMSVRKPKFVSEIKTFKKEVVKVTVAKLTKEIYQELKAQSPPKSDAWIVRKYGYNNVSFYKLKNTWGLVTGKGRRPDAPIKNKTLADVTFVEEEPKQEFNPNILVGLAEEKIKSLEEIILERDNYIKKLHNLRSEDVGVINKLKEKIKGLEVDNGYLKEDFKITIEKLNHANDNEKLLRLESLLKHSEQTNDSLIAQLKSVNKYKSLYFKTAETLKLHLPN